jgi:hypothetical protein
VGALIPCVTEAQKPLDNKLEKLSALTAHQKGAEFAPLRAILVKMGEVPLRLWIPLGRAAAYQHSIP